MNQSQVEDLQKMLAKWTPVLGKLKTLMGEQEAIVLAIGSEPGQFLTDPEALEAFGKEFKELTGRSPEIYRAKLLSRS